MKKIEDEYILTKISNNEDIFTKISMNEELQDYYEEAFPELWNDLYIKAVADFLQKNKGKYFHNISDRLFRIKTMRALMRKIQEKINE